MVVLMGNALRLVTLVFVAGVLTVESAHWLPRAAAQEPRVVEVTAERFAFTPSQIRVKAGLPVEIRLQSDDTAHGFRIVGTDIDVELPKRGRGTATVTFLPKAGRYTFECSNLCGAGHEFMRGVIIASE
jgi:cytochrome c oxidase subunit 2